KEEIHGRTSRTPDLSPARQAPGQARAGRASGASAVRPHRPGRPEAAGAPAAVLARGGGTPAVPAPVRPPPAALAPSAPPARPAAPAAPAVAPRHPPEHQAELLRDGLFACWLAVSINLDGEFGQAGCRQFLEGVLREAGDPQDPVEARLVRQLALADLRVVQL